MSLFFVDSGCDIAINHLNNLGIECIYLPYELEDRTLNFSENFDYQKFYSKCKKGLKVNFKTFTKQEYVDIFEPALKNGDDVVYIHSSSKLIDYSSLSQAKELLLRKYPERKMFLLDSHNLSLGQGVLSIILANLYRNGATISEIEEKYYSTEQEIAMYLVLDSAETLSKFGVTFDGVYGTALNVKPIVCVDIDGNLRVIDKASGKKKGISKLVDIVRMSGENVVDYPLGVCYSGDEESAKILSSKLKEYFGSDIELFENFISPSNVAILGSGAVGVVFHVHKKIH